MPETGRGNGDDALTGRAGIDVNLGRHGIPRKIRDLKAGGIQEKS